MSPQTSTPDIYARQDGKDGQPLSNHTGRFGFAAPNTDAAPSVSESLLAGATPGRTVRVYDLECGDVLVSADGDRVTILDVQDLPGRRVEITTAFGKIEADADDKRVVAEPDQPAAPAVTAELVFAELIAATGTEFWTNMADSDRTPAALLACIGRVGDPDLSCLVAANDGTDVETRDLLSRHEDPAFRAATIAWRGADAGFLARFEGDDDYDVVSALCSAKGIDPEQLRRLRAAEWACTYDMLANPALPADLFAEMYAEGNSMDRRCALDSPNATLHFVELAADDEDPAVRAAALQHGLATPALLDAKMDDPSASVRRNIAWHRNTNPSTVKAMLGDQEKNVRDAAEQRLRIARR